MGDLRIGCITADSKRDPDANDIIGALMEVHAVLGNGFLKSN